MASERTDRVELLQGTLDLIVLRALATMGTQHPYLDEASQQVLRQILDLMKPNLRA